MLSNLVSVVQTIGLSVSDDLGKSTSSISLHMLVSLH